MSERQLSVRAATMSLLAAGVLSLLPAATLKGVTLADSASVGGKALVLNGIGVRQATMFRVKVYVMGLYLEEKSADAEGIVNSAGRKRVVQHYVRDVGKQKLVEGWQGSIEGNNDNIDAIRKEYETFLSYVTPLKKNERMVIDFVEDRVEVTAKGQKKDPISSRAFQKALLRAWLGPKPTYPPLKKAILAK